LDERGIDTHKIKYGKAEAAFWGIEHLNKAKKKEAAMIQKGKDTIKKVGEESAGTINPDEDDGLRNWKRELIYGKGRQF
jgi:hypothetical protein